MTTEIAGALGFAFKPFYIEKEDAPVQTKVLDTSISDFKKENSQPFSLSQSKISTTPIDLTSSKSNPTESILPIDRSLPFSSATRGISDDPNRDSRIAAIIHKILKDRYPKIPQPASSKEKDIATQWHENECKYREFIKFYKQYEFDRKRVSYD